MTVLLRLRPDVVRELAIDDWAAPATPGELELVQHLPGPVLDLGCGPGRVVTELVARGKPALGIDASPHAIRWAIDRGATALCRSIFDPLPGEGRWGTVLLLDGNIGIGGDPTALLARVGQLLARTGFAIIEVEAPGQPTFTTVARLERGAETTPWFPWSCVGADDIARFAAIAGLHVHQIREVDAHWYATLRSEL